MVKGDYNVNNANKVTVPLQPARLEQPDACSPGPRRSALAPADQHDAVPDASRTRTTRSSRTSSRASASGTRCSAAADEQPADRLHAPGREPRSQDQTPLFPFVVIGDGDGSAIDLVRQRAVHAVQPAPLQHVPGAGQRDEVRRRTTRSPSAATSRSSTRTTRSTSASRARYSYDTLADFYADANGYLANPNRTVSPVQPEPLPGRSTCCQPGQTTPPLQPLDVDLRRRLHPGRVAAEVEPDGDRRLAHRRAEVRQHGVRQPGRRRADRSAIRTARR